MDRVKRRKRDHAEDLGDSAGHNHAKRIPKSTSHLHMKAENGTSSDDIKDIKVSSIASSCCPKGLHQQQYTLGLGTGEVHNLVDINLAKFLISNNMAFDAVKEPYFLEFVKGLCGPDYKPPSPLMLQRMYYLQVEIEVEKYVSDVRQSWETTGCTITLDKWKNFINVIAYSPKGRVFLQSRAVLAYREESKCNLQDLICSVIQDIGVDQVVQIITNDDMMFDSVKNVVLNEFPQVYQIPCVAHEIYSLIKAIYGEVGWVHSTINCVMFVVNSIYEDDIILSLMRKFTNHKDLKQPFVSKFASDYHILHSVLANKCELQKLIASREWKLLNYNRNRKVLQITGIVQSAYFWSQMQQVLDVMEPLVQVLRLAEDDGSTSGYLYEAMEKAREVIKKHHCNDQTKYSKILELFETWRSNNIIHPIHAAAAILNPAYMCRQDFKLDAEMKVGLDFALKTLVRNEEKVNFVEETELYLAKVSKVFNENARQLLKDAHPVKWWNSCGDNLPILKSCAIRILSQPCKCSCDLKPSISQVPQGYGTMTKSWSDLVCLTMNTKIMGNCKSFEQKCLEPIDTENCKGTDFLHLDYKPKDLQEFFPYLAQPLSSSNILPRKFPRRWTKILCVVKWVFLYKQIQERKLGSLQFYDYKSYLGGRYFRTSAGVNEDLFNGTDYMIQVSHDYFVCNSPAASKKAQRRWTKMACVVKWFVVYLQIQCRTCDNLEFYDHESSESSVGGEFYESVEGTLRLDRWC